jgi:hypothetical protein
LLKLHLEARLIVPLVTGAAYALGPVVSWPGATCRPYISGVFMGNALRDDTLGVQINFYEITKVFMLAGHASPLIAPR